jgi:serine/threonine-protein kinase
MNLYTFQTNYRIIRKIGSGGMATVYEALNEALDNKVAVKVLHEQFSDHETVRIRFSNEAKLMASLVHPNIVQVKDYDNQSNQPAIIMEYLEGEDLNVRLKKKQTYSENEVFDIFKQLLSAIAYSHKKGIVHRDIKPSNIFSLQDGTIKILDFGIAKILDQGLDITITGAQIGTPSYMSPEQIRGDRKIDLRTDIYSLGITMYALLTGSSPYSSELTNREIEQKIQNEHLTELVNHPIFWKFISKACQKDPDLRYQTCEEWLAELKQVDSKVDEAITIPDDDSITIPDEIPTIHKVEKSEELKEDKSLDIFSKIVVLILLLLIVFGLIQLMSKADKEYPVKPDKNVSIEPVQVQSVDQEAKFFDAVKIGSQTWMSQNLNVSRFRNGDLIPEVKNDADWKKAGENKQPAWCYYDFDSKNEIKYGKLYNWYAVNDSRGLAPVGWHVPENIEFKSLLEFLGGVPIAFGKMKSDNGWFNNGYGTNESGFNGLPGGYCGYLGKADSLGYHGYWWTSTEYDNNTANFFNLNFQNVNYNESQNSKVSGFSIRCVKE